MKSLDQASDQIVHALIKHMICVLRDRIFRRTVHMGEQDTSEPLPRFWMDYFYDNKTNIGSFPFASRIVRCCCHIQSGAFEIEASSSSLRNTKSRLDLKAFSKYLRIDPIPYGTFGSHQEAIRDLAPVDSTQYSPRLLGEDRKCGPHFGTSCRHHTALHSRPSVGLLIFFVQRGG